MSVLRVARWVVGVLFGVPALIGLVALCIYGVAAPWASYEARDAAFRSVVLRPLCVQDASAFAGLLLSATVAGLFLFGMIFVPPPSRSGAGDDL